MLWLLHYRGRIWVVHRPRYRTTTNYILPLIRCTQHSASLHWCHDKRPCSGTALYMEQISAQLPYRVNTASAAVIHEGRSTACLTMPLPSKWFLFPLMSAHHSLRSHSPLKSVLNKIGDSFHTYVNTYKTHAMATHHGGTGQPQERASTSHEQDLDTQANIIMRT